MIKRIIIFLKKHFISYGVFHGIRKILITSIYKRLTDNIMADHVYAKSSFRYVERFYKRNKKEYVFPCPENDVGENEFILWTCWLQGIETAPPLVKTCINSAVKYAGSRRVIVLTYDNLENYISLPSFIMEKHKKGYIQFPAFTNIIRTYLLYFYGGLWFDSTVLFTQPVPDNLLLEDIFFFKSPLDDKHCPWSSWFIIAAKRKNYLLYNLLCALLAYWQKKNKYIDYFIFHYSLQAIINNDDLSAKIYDKIPYYNNQNPHYLQMKLLFSEFNNELWDIVKNVSFCHKLTYKNPNINNKKECYSFYSYLSDK